MSKKYWSLLIALFLLLIFSCGTKPPPPWPWWTAQDSLAVLSELALWRDSINGFHFLKKASGDTLMRNIEISIPLASEDLVSRTGDSLIKIAHLLGCYEKIGDSLHIDEMIFGVKVDTLQTKDTFCFVTYKDSTRNCIAALRFDSLWTVKFRIDTILTNVTPWETIWELDTFYKRGFAYPEEEEKKYHFTTVRKLELRKEKFQTVYKLKYLTGFTMYLPSSAEAPKVKFVAFIRPERSDTFYAFSSSGRLGVMNLKLKDSIFRISKNELVNVKILADSSADNNYFFMSYGLPNVSSKYNITKSSGTGQTTVSFSSEGLKHLYFEVIPGSNLYYPSSLWKSTTWAIPINVVP